MVCTQKNFKECFKTEIVYVYFCDHIMDNTFVRSKLTDTIDWCNQLGYFPRGYCINPEYSPSSGIALCMIDAKCNDFWVHVPRSLFRNWLTQVGENWETHPIFKKTNIKEEK